MIEYQEVGELKSKKKVTLLDVARVAGVSPSTVSRVLNGFPYINEETRRRVMKAVETLNYVPDYFARNLRKGMHTILGFIVPEQPERISGDFYLAEMIAVMDEVAGRKGMGVTVWVSPVLEGDKILEWILSRGLSGVVINAFPETVKKELEKHLKRLADFNIPVVLLGVEWSGKWAKVDCESGIKKAVEYLKNLGHKKIAFWKGDERYLASREKLRGYNSSLHFSHRLVIPTYISDDELSGFIDEAMENEFTALITSTDEQAYRLLKILHKKGIDVPGDLSVVGFDDLPFSDYTYPPLTTLKVPLKELMEGSIGLLEDGETSSYVVTPELVVRESCRAI